MKTLVILGTSRAESNTLKAIEELCPFAQYELIDLRNFKIGHYQYDHSANEGDDFQLIASKMKAADHIVFATPVYRQIPKWKKDLFDRIGIRPRAAARI